MVEPPNLFSRLWTGPSDRHALQAGTIISKRQTRKAMRAKRQVAQVAPAGLVDSGSALPKQHTMGNVQAAQEATTRPPKPPSEKSSPSEKATPKGSPSDSSRSPA